MADIVATAETEIDAPPARVWQALTDPAQIKEYMFGSSVETDWKPGSSITWKGSYGGKAYEDRGRVVDIKPEQLLVVTHFSPMSGLEDRPENYHTLTYELEERGGRTHLSLSQSGNPTEEAATHARDNWSRMLDGLRALVERDH